MDEKKKACRNGKPSSLACMARPERFELPTAWFVARYSIQLSYGRCVRDRIIGKRPIERKGPPGIGDGGERGIRTLDEAINPILP